MCLLDSKDEIRSHERDGKVGLDSEVGKAIAIGVALDKEIGAAVVRAELSRDAGEGARADEAEYVVGAGVRIGGDGRGRARIFRMSLI